VESFGQCVGSNNWDSGEQDKFKMRCFLTAISSDDPYKSLNNLFSGENPPISLDHDCFNKITTFLEQFSQKN
jgi:hypothetical protein